MANTTNSFIDSLLALSSQQIPAAVYRKARFCLLDFIGEAFAGSRLHQERMLLFVRDMGGDLCETATIIGCAAKSTMQNAAFVNSFNVHSTEMDDGHRYGMLHLGASVIAAVIASAEKEKADFEDVIRGIVMGYEAAIRLAECIQPNHKQHGFHTSGTCGTIGAAMGVAFLNKYNRSQLLSTLAMAVTSAAGILEIQEESSELKPYNLARAAMDGLTAAYMGKSEWLGPDDILGGKRGFFRVFGEMKRSHPSFTKQTAYAIEGIYMKPYAACRHCHAPIEGALSVVMKNRIEEQQIESIKVKTYSMAVLGHNHTEICGSSSAKLSIPFGVALAIITGDANLSQFETLYDDVRILNLTKKVSVVEDEFLSSLVPIKRAAKVEITTRSGNSYEEMVEYPLGEPENPMTENHLIKKFKALCEYAGIPHSEYSLLIKGILN